MTGLLSHTFTTAIVAVPGTDADLPLVITVLRVDRPADGRHRWVWTVSGFIESDARGGTREPVTITGTDLYSPGARMPGELARTLARFLGVDRDILARLCRDDLTTYDRVMADGSADDVPATEHYVPAYSARQWALIEAEGQRLGDWASEVPA